ncbi:MAG: tetratricopeptide repeat protein, partial [Oxalobacteraceae bacterium]
MPQPWIVAVATVILAMIGPAVSAQSAAGQESDSVAARYENTVADVNATMLVDPAKALPKAVAAEHLAAKIVNLRARGVAIATARWLQGESYLRTNDTDRADAPIRSALAAIKTFHPQSKLHADLLISMGWLDSSQGRAGSALIDYQRAFAIYRRLGDARGQSRTLVFIAMLYTEAKDPNTADKYYQQALDIYHADANIAVSIYNNRALVL